MLVTLGRQERSGELDAFVTDALRLFPDSPELHYETYDYLLAYDLERAKEHAASGRRRFQSAAFVTHIEGDARAALAAYELAEARHDTTWTTTGGLRNLVQELDRPLALHEHRVVATKHDGLPFRSPDGTLAASFTAGILWLRDGRDGHVTHWFPTGGTWLAGFDPTGTRVLVGGASHWRVYEARTGSLVGAVPREAMARFSPDGALLAQPWGRGGGVLVHDVATGALVRQLNAGIPGLGSITRFAWSPDGRHLALGYRTPSTASVVVMDAQTGDVVHELDASHPDLAPHGVSGWCKALEFSPDGALLAFSMEGQAAFHTLTVASGRIRTVPGAAHANALFFSPGGTVVAQKDWRFGGDWASVYRLDDGAHLGTVELQNRAWQLSVDDEGRVLMGNERYEVATGALIDAFEAPVADVQFPSLEGERLQLVDQDRGVTGTWGLRRGRWFDGYALPAYDRRQDQPGDDKTRFYAVHGHQVVYKPEGEQRLALFDAQRGEDVRDLAWMPDHALWKLSIDPTGTRALAVFVQAIPNARRTAFVSGFRDLDLAYVVYDLQTGERRSVVRTPLVTQRNAESASLQITYWRSGVWNVHWSPSGDRYLVRPYYTLRQRGQVGQHRLDVYDADSGAPIVQHSIDRAPTAAGFSADGGRLAVGFDNGVVWLYDVGTRLGEQYLGHVVTNNTARVRTVVEHEGDWFVGSGRTVERWTVQTETRHATYDGHLGTVWSVLPVPGRDRVAFVGDGEVTVWTLGQARKLATLLLLDNAGWAAFTPEGWYEADLDGEAGIAWAKDGEITPFSTYAASLHNPTAVYETLTYGEVRSADAEIDTTTLLEALPPVLELLAPADGTELASDQATLEVQVTSPDAPVKAVLVRSDGLTVANQRLADATGARGVQKVNVPVDLFDGENTLQVYAQTDTARSNIARLKLIRQAGTTTSANGSLAYLGIGVSDYEQDFDLDYADDDATALEAALREMAGDRPFHSTVLTDASATKRNVIDAFKRVRADCTAETTLVAFIGAHGIHSDNELYFMAHDSELELPEDSAVWWRRIDSLLDNTGCGQTLLLLDTCHAGDFYDQTRALDAFAGVPSNDPFAGLLARGSGVRVLAASRGEQKSLEHARWGGGHGVFTWSVLQALGDAATDLNGNGKVSVTELELAVKRRVLEETNFQQEPTSPKTSTGYRDFELGRLSPSE